MNKQTRESKNENEQPLDEGAKEETAEGQKIKLEDLQPAVNVSAGFDHKATDVTLKRGVID